MVAFKIQNTPSWTSSKQYQFHEKKKRIIKKALAFFLLFCRSIYEMFRLAFLIIFPIRGRSISGEVTIVTGAGQGIGRALALELAKEGAVVICVDKRSEPNEETALMVKDRRGLAYAFTCDVTR